MHLLRTQRAIQLSRSLARAQHPARPLTTTSHRRLGEPNPREIPDVDAMHMTEDQASMVVAEVKPEHAVPVPDNQPDYNAHVDHGTSTFSRVPRRVMDGSEPGEILPAAVLSGAPVDLQARTVR
jgi:NADH dehydrogenase (ubiquinone) Fe-S protein 4